MKRLRWLAGLGLILLAARGGAEELPGAWDCTKSPLLDLLASSVHRDLLEARLNLQLGVGFADVRGFRSSKALKQHFAKHGAEFPFAERNEYKAAALAFARSTASDVVTLEACRKDVIYRYQPGTNEFMVLDLNHFILTYFKPVTEKFELRSEDEMHAVWRQFLRCYKKKR